MATTLSGWKRVHTSMKKGSLALYKETFTFGTGATDVYGSEFGDGVTTANVPQPPAGVDFTVLFVQNNTMSTAGDIVLLGAEASGGTFAILKDNLIAYAASSSGGTSTAAQYVQREGVTPTGGRLPVFKFMLDADGAHSASTGTDKTTDLYISWIIP